MRIQKNNFKNNEILQIYINEKEQKILERGVDKATEAVLEILENGVDIAMNKYNSNN